MLFFFFFFFGGGEGVSENFICLPCQPRLAGLGAEKACEVGEVGPFKLFCSLASSGGLGAGSYLPGPIVNE